MQIFLKTSNCAPLASPNLSVLIEVKMKLLYSHLLTPNRLADTYRPDRSPPLRTSCHHFSNSFEFQSNLPFCQIFDGVCFDKG